MPKISYHDSEGVEKSIELGTEPVFIGRAPECQIQTSDTLVSRRHARIVFEGGGYWVEDLNSSNGVYVDSEKVHRAPLRPGDEALCGSLALRLIADVAAAVKPPQDPAAAAEPPPAAPASARSPLVPLSRFGDLENTRGQGTAPPPGPDPHDAAETERLRRQVEQLRSELARLRTRGGAQPAAAPGIVPDAAAAVRIAELEGKVLALEQERDALLQAKSAAAPIAAPALDRERLGERLGSVSDALASLRGALRAAGDDLALEELEQARNQVREALALLGTSR